MRGECLGFEGISGGDCPSRASPSLSLTLPGTCGEPLQVRMDSWQQPGAFVERTAVRKAGTGNALGLSGCGELEFDPAIETEVGSPAADSGSAIAAHLHVPQNDNPDEPGAADVRSAVVTLPPGVSINPPAASWLDSCRPREFALESSTVPTCPPSSAIGSVEIVSPLLEGPLLGQVYLAAPEQPVHEHVRRLPRRRTRRSSRQAGRADRRRPRHGPAHAGLRRHARAVVLRPGAELRRWAARAAGDATPLRDLHDRDPVDPVLDVPRRHALEQLRRRSRLRRRLLAVVSGRGGERPGRRRHRPHAAAVARRRRRNAAELLGGAAAGPRPAARRRRAVRGGAGRRRELRPGQPGRLDRDCRGGGAGPFDFVGKVFLTGPYGGAPFGLSIAIPGVAGPLDLGTVVVRARVWSIQTTRI